MIAFAAPKNNEFTTLQIALLTDKKYCEVVLAVCINKVFDKVPHKRLLKKLSGYGIKGKVYNWIKEFLSQGR